MSKHPVVETFEREGFSNSLCIDNPQIRYAFTYDEPVNLLSVIFRVADVVGAVSFLARISVDGDDAYKTIIRIDRVTPGSVCQSHVASGTKFYVEASVIDPTSHTAVMLSAPPSLVTDEAIEPGDALVNLAAQLNARLMSDKPVEFVHAYTGATRDAVALRGKHAVLFKDFIGTARLIDCTDVYIIGSTEADIFLRDCANVVIKDAVNDSIEITGCRYGAITNAVDSSLVVDRCNNFIIEAVKGSSLSGRGNETVYLWNVERLGDLESFDSFASYDVFHSGVSSVLDENYFKRKISAAPLLSAWDHLNFNRRVAGHFDVQWPPPEIDRSYRRVATRPVCGGGRFRFLYFVAVVVACVVVGYGAYRGIGSGKPKKTTGGVRYGRSVRGIRINGRKTGQK